VKFIREKNGAARRGDSVGATPSAPSAANYLGEVQGEVGDE